MRNLVTALEGAVSVAGRRRQDHVYVASSGSEATWQRVEGLPRVTWGSTNVTSTLLGVTVSRLQRPAGRGRGRRW
ncbi:hypothetical protein [Nonomuraea dietziae]|uniref:hypothetical protein n=1 Tax=Nonomuraea dietziae TaxID=65515 RepID=UPI0031D417F9